MRLLSFVLALAISIVPLAVQAQQVVLPCTQIAGQPFGSCQPVTATAPLPVTAVGGISNATAEATGSTTARTLADHFADHYSVKDWGAKCDGYQLFNGTVTNGSPIISAKNSDGTAHPFTATDVGATVVVTSLAAGAPHGPWTISSINGNGTANLNTNADFSQADTVRFVIYHTDDTAAINAATAAVSQTLNGGYLDFPRGICPASHITVYRNEILNGEGRESTVLYQLPASNTTFLTSENFATLTGTGLNYGPDGTFNGIVSSYAVPSWFGLKDIGIDGDRLQQTSGTDNCVSFYGNAQVWIRTMVANCRSNGMWTEASGSFAYSSTDWHAEEEGFFDDIITRNVGDNGWVMRGPHDSVITSFLGYDWDHNNNGNVSPAYGMKVEGSGTAYSGSGHFNQIHAYTSANTNSRAFYFNVGADVQFLYSDFGSTTIAGGGMKIGTIYLLSCGYGSVTPCLDIQADKNNIGAIYGIWYFGTLPTGLTMVNINSNANTIGAMWATSSTSTTASNTLIKFGVGAAFNHVTANIGNMIGTSNKCVDFAGSYNFLDLTAFGCTTFINYTAGNGHNNVRALLYNPSGTAWGGDAPTATDAVTLQRNTGANFLQVPGIAIGTNAPNTGASIDLGSQTDSLLLPVGTTGQRPTGVNGMIRYNSTTPGFEGFVSGAWGALGGGSASGSDTQVQYNSSGSFGASANLTWVSPKLTIGAASSATGQLGLAGTTSGVVTVQPAAAAGTWTLTLPTTGGTNGYFLQTNGSGVTTWAAQGASTVSTVVQPMNPFYTTDTAGRLFPSYYAGGGGNASSHDYGIGIKASLDADATAELRFSVPPTVPSGTLKLRMLCLANATANAIKYTVSDANVAAGASPSAATLTAETQNTITWAAGGADKYTEAKTTLSATPAGNDMLVVAIKFQTTGWTQNVAVTCLPTVLWE